MFLGYSAIYTLTFKPQLWQLSTSQYPQFMLSFIASCFSCFIYSAILLAIFKACIDIVPYNVVFRPVMLKHIVVTVHITRKSLSIVCKMQQSNRCQATKPNSRMETQWRSEDCMHVLFLVFIFWRISRNVRQLVFWVGFYISCLVFLYSFTQIITIHNCCCHSYNCCHVVISLGLDRWKVACLNPEAHSSLGT